MATVKKQGKGYKITVSHGYDINGKQLRQHMTWVPAPGMTPRQIERELDRQKILFEEQVKCSVTHDGSIRLNDFTSLFLKEYAYPMLKAKTAFGYSCLSTKHGRMPNVICWGMHGETKMVVSLQPMTALLCSRTA